MIKKIVVTVVICFLTIGGVSISSKSVGAQQSERIKYNGEYDCGAGFLRVLSCKGPSDSDQCETEWRPGYGWSWVQLYKKIDTRKEIFNRIENCTFTPDKILSTTTIVSRTTYICEDFIDIEGNRRKEFEVISCSGESNTECIIRNFVAADRSVATISCQKL